MTPRRLGVARCLVGGHWVDGDVSIDGDGRVAAVGLAGGGHGSAVPGFVDLQVNGFAGVDFRACDADGHRRASVAMARTGVTAFLVTVPTAAPEHYREILGVAAAAIDQPPLGARPIGVHLEGPFLARPGAHRRDWFRPATTESADTLLAMAPVAMMTVAPEISGGLTLVDHLSRRGVVVSVGHTDATAAEAHAAFDAGARAVTHLWNAQPAMTSRAPGVVGVALARPDVAVGIICDLVHVAAETVAVSVAAAAGRTFAVTDATAFAGAQPGSVVGGEGAMYRDGAVRLPDGTLAGSVATLDRSLRTLVALGLDLRAAVASVTSVPAGLIGRSDLGTIHLGGRADIVVLDDDLSLRRVLVGGSDVD